MGENSGISWTHHTFSPWWGCERVSDACRFCYAETLAKRTGNDVWGKKAPRRFLSDAQWRKPLKWDREAAASGEQTLVFCGSMCDVFEDREDLLNERRRLWDLVYATPHLTWQLLTKRPENVERMVPQEWMAGRWPTHVRLGVTAENQDCAEERIPILVSLPAPVRFISAEPLLSDVDVDLTGVDQVIMGGESGPKRRFTDVAWYEALAQRARAAGACVFVKQDSALYPGQQGRIPAELWELKEIPA